MEYTEAVNHVNEQPSEDIKKFAHDVAPSYLFVKRVLTRVYRVYCTNCNKAYLSEDKYTKHHEIRNCEKCEKKSIVYQSGRGRKYLIDDFYLEYFSKSLIDKETVVCEGYYVRIDYSEDYTKPIITYERLALYIFNKHVSDMFKGSFYASSFEKAKTVYSLHNTSTSMGHKQAFMNKNLLEDIVKGTPYEYSQWRSYPNEYMLEYMALYQKYPFVEILTKLNMRQIILGRLQKQSLRKVINWRGKTLNKIIGLNKSDWSKFPLFNGTVDIITLENFKVLRAIDKKSEPIFLLHIAKSMYFSYLMKVHEITKMKIPKIIEYVQSQKLNLYKYDKYSFDGITMYLDYLNDCKDLGMDIKYSYYLKPKNLKKLHQIQIQQKKEKADKILNEKFKKRFKVLNKYSLTIGDYFIRPYKDVDEINQDGNDLKICVASNYSKRYAEGETELYYLRKVNEPNKSFFVIEIKNGHLIQCQGYSHQLPTKVIKKVLQTFLDKNFNAQKVKKIS